MQGFLTVLFYSGDGEIIVCAKLKNSRCSLSCNCLVLRLLSVVKKRLCIGWYAPELSFD